MIADEVFVTSTGLGRCKSEDAFVARLLSLERADRHVCMYAAAFPRVDVGNLSFFSSC